MIAGHSLGFLLGCVLAVHLIRGIGAVPAVAALVGTLAAAALAFIAVSDVWAWFVFRVVIGFSAAGVYVVVETWINDQISSRVRGVIMTAYTTTLRLAMTLGQAMLVFPFSDQIFFAICAVCFALAFVPIAALPASGPTVQAAGLPNPLDLLRVAPVAALGCFGAGLLNLPMMNLGPVYAIQVGHSTAQAALLASAMQVSALVLSWPLGWLSDKIDRRRTILAATVGSLVGSVFLLLASVSPSPLLLLAGFGLAGGFSFTLYSLSAAHGFDSAERERLATLASALMLTWGIGSIVGPLLAAWCMEWLGPQGLPVYVLCVSFGLAGFTGWRAWKKSTLSSAPPVDTRQG